MGLSAQMVVEHKLSSSVTAARIAVAEFRANLGDDMHGAYCGFGSSLTSC